MVGTGTKDGIGAGLARRADCGAETGGVGGGQGGVTEELRCFQPKPQTEERGFPVLKLVSSDR